MAVQVAPLCEAEDKCVSAPHPHPHPRSASFKCGSRREGGPASPLRAPGWGGPHSPKPGSARQGAPGPQPPPQASPLPGPAFPPQPLTCSCSQLCRCGRRLRPRRFRSAPARLPPAPPAAAPLAPLPDSLLPPLYLAPEAATATRAVRRTPPPDRDTSHLPDRARTAWQRAAVLARAITMAAAAAEASGC